MGGEGFAVDASLIKADANKQRSVPGDEGLPPGAAKLDRLRLRGPCDARDEFLLAATAQNLRKLAKLIQQPATAAA